MSQKIREEMLPRLRQRYASRGREGRSRLLDEECEQWGYERKHAIKLLGARAGWGGDLAAAKGRPPKYGAAVAEVPWRIWKVAEQPCGKRLAAMRAQWLPHYEAIHGKLPRQVEAAKRARFWYIEGCDNRTRLHGARGFHSPVDFENRLNANPINPALRLGLETRARSVAR